MATGANSSSVKIPSGFCDVFDFIDSPISSACCNDKYECIKNIFVNYCANLNFQFLSSLSFSDSIINTIDKCAQATISPELKNTIKAVVKPYFEISGKAEPSISEQSTSLPLNLIDFIVPTLFLYLTTNKVKNSTIEIFKSLSKLTKGILLGEWSSNKNIRSKNRDYTMYGETSQKHTFTGLCSDILIQTAIATIWAGMAILTQRGMRNALANATDNPIAQDAITGLNAAIMAAHLLSIPLVLKNSKMQLSTHYNSEEPSALDDDNEYIKGTKRRKTDVASDEPRIDIFDLSECDPEKLPKVRKSKTNSSPSLPALNESIEIDDL